MSRRLSILTVAAPQPSVAIHSDSLVIVVRIKLLREKPHRGTNVSLSKKENDILKNNRMPVSDNFGLIFDDVYPFHRTGY
jgi:hypothetical protein